MSVFIEEVPDLQALVTKLRRLHGLSDEDRAALEHLPLRTDTVAAGKDIVRVAERAGRCAIILEGLAFGYKLTGDGQRQILCLYLAGDLPDLQTLHFGITDTGVGALSTCRVGYVPYDALKEMCSRQPNLTTVLWRETLLQAAIVREWLLNVGRRSALVSLSHLLCEIVIRHRVAGLTSDYSCSFPFTQTLLADALGLSAVHVNRTVQTLRADGLIEWEHRHLTVLDWERLRALADFHPAYLHLDPSTT